MILQFEVYFYCNIDCLSTVYLYGCCVRQVSAADRDQQWQFAPSPQFKGGPKLCLTRSNNIRFIIHIPVQLSKGFVLLYC